MSQSPVIEVPNVVHNTALPHGSASRNRHHVRVQSACACKASVKSILCRVQCYENQWCPCAPTLVSSQEHCSSVKCAHGALVQPWRHWSCPVRVGPAGFAVRALTRKFANCSMAICLVTGVVEHHLQQALFAAHRSEFSPGDRSCGPASHNPPERVAPAQLQAASKLCTTILLPDPRDSKFTGTTTQPQQLLQQSTLPSGKQGEDLDKELRTSSRAKIPLVLASQRSQTGQGGGLWLEANRANRAQARSGLREGRSKGGSPKSFFLFAFFWCVFRFWWPSPGVFPAFLAFSWGRTVRSEGPLEV